MERILNPEALKAEVLRLQTYKMFCDPEAEKLVSQNDVLELIEELTAKATPVTRCKGCVHFKPLKEVELTDGSRQKIGCCTLWNRVKGKYFPTENNTCSEVCNYDNN